MPPARKPKTPSVSASSSSATTAASSSTSPPAPASSSRPSRSRQDSSAALHDMPDADITPSSAASTSSQWTEPPWMGFLETTEDALLILEAARRRLIPRVTRRLADRERRLIQSGSVFVFEEEESGIKRWTDGFLWSPSRILGNFLLYRETDKRNPDGTPATRPGRSNTTSSISGPSTTASAPHSLLVTEEPATSPSAGSLSRPKPLDGEGLNVGGYSAAGTSGLDRARERILLGSLTNSHKFKEDGMMKKTFSLTLPNTTKTHHLVSYYKVSDVEAGRLRTPSSLPEFAALEISPEFLDKTHFRVQPRVEVGEDGRVRFRGETTDEPDSPTGATNESAQDVPPTSTHSNPPPSSVHLQSHGHHPYHPRPQYSQPSHSTPIYPTHGQHSRNNSLNNAPTEFTSALAAAAKAQAEASARMYMNGAATAAAASGSSTTSSSSSSKSFFQTPVVNGGVGSTASNLGLHYPSALGYTTASPTMMSPSTSYSGMMGGGSSSSSSGGTKSRSGSIYSPTGDYTSPTSYSMTDNSTGAPPFQAPQLYNPSQPSASANSAFATASYPSSLAPSHRSASVAYSVGTASVRSGATDDVSVVSGRMGRSGSRGSDGSGGPGSLSSSSTLTISEAATPSVTSSRRSSTSHYRTDPLALDKILAVKAEQDAAAAANPYDYMGYNYVGLGMMGVGVEDLNLGMDTMVMSPEEAPGNGTWCGASNNAATTGDYVDYSAGYAGYSIPPPTAKQQQHQQHFQHQHQYVYPQQSQTGFAGAEDGSGGYYGGGRM